MHGNWKRVYVIPYGESLDVVPGCWQELVPGKNMGWANCPLCLVFEREDGVRMEYSLGFDLWRWNYGIGLQDGTSLEIEVEEDALQLSRYLAKDMPEDGLIPEARDYRFMASIAWSSPEMLSTITPAPDKVVDLSINPKRGLDLSGLGEVESKSLALRFKYDDLPCPDSERRRDADGKTGKPCLETGNAISSLKRYIRQLAAIGANGGYLAIDGLTPGLCFVGSHCDKKSNRIHWDLQDILTFAAWAKNCLGDDWTLEFPQPEGWCELPSLAGMGLPNGFVYA